MQLQPHRSNAVQLIPSIPRPRPHRFIRTALLALCLGGLSPQVGMAQTSPQPSPEPIIDVGVVQRFGSEAADKMTIQALGGDRLTLRFQTGGQEQTITTAGPVRFEIGMETLPEPQVTERVVLSTHRSFESAEDSANQWRARGIEVELAQPRQWQVWAKRDTYHSPLLRRLLVQNLRSHGARAAFLDTQVQPQRPRAAFIADGYRYARDRVEITSANGRIQVTNPESVQRLYAGSLRIQPNAYGTYTLVNRVPIESYLRGVVPHEIGVGAPPPTIEAQAILARTYALRNLRRFAIDDYQLCADTQCQVYWGVSGATPQTDQAIQATRNQVLTYQNELVDALYSSTTGGVTAAFTDVWNGEDRPYLRPVVDSVQNIWDLSSNSLADETNFRNFINLSQQQGFNEAGWDMFRWRRQGTLPEIASDLKRYLQATQHPLADFGSIQQMQVVKRSTGGRVQKLAIQTNLGVVELEKDEILRALYTPNSILFYLEPIYDPASAPASPNPASGQASTPTPTPDNRVLKGYAFVGGGLGHGVGMSQTGAYRLGRMGWTGDRILSFYFPGAQVQTLNNTITFWREPSQQVATQPQAE